MSESAPNFAETTVLVNPQAAIVQQGVRTDISEQTVHRVRIKTRLIYNDVNVKDIKKTIQN